MKSFRVCDLDIDLLIRMAETTYQIEGLGYSEADRDRAVLILEQLEELLDDNELEFGEDD